MVVGLEGYAYGEKHHAHANGETGGAVRCAFLRQCAGTKVGMMRVHGPEAVKLAAMGKTRLGKINGKKPTDKEKKAPIIAYARELGYDVPETGKSSDLDGDMADARVLAHLVLIEWCVRRGLMTMAELTDRMREVFHKAPTKYHRVNLLARPYLVPGGEWP